MLHSTFNDLIAISDAENAVTIYETIYRPPGVILRRSTLFMKIVVKIIGHYFISVYFTSCLKMLNMITIKKIGKNVVS